MDLEKIFKNLIIADFVSVFFVIISAMIMPKELMEISEYLPAGIYQTEFGAVLSILILISFHMAVKLLILNKINI